MCKPNAIKAEISFEGHSRLIRARSVAASIYDYLLGRDAEFGDIPWLPEILDYLCKDIDVILHEIDEWELRDSQERINAEANDLIEIVM